MTVVAALLGALLVVVTDNDGGNPESATSDQVLTAPVNGLVVTLRRLGGGSADATIGRPDTLVVEVIAEAAVDEIQLWDGADQLGRRVLDGQATSRRELITWQPGEIGDVALSARAVDERGRSAQSNVVRLSVGEYHSPLVWAEVETVEGDSLAGIADTYGASPDDVVGANPDLDPDAALSPGTTVAVPIVDPAGLADLTDASGAVDLGLWSDAIDDLQFVLEPPLASTVQSVVPQVSAAVADCAVTVDIVGPGERFVVFELAPSSSAYVELASIDAASDGPTQWTANLGPGRRTLVIGAERDGGLNLSAPVEVAVPESCGGQWSGEVRLVGGLLTVVGNDAPADAAYTYLSTNGTDWQRVPGDEGAAVPFNGIGFDVHAYLPSLGGSQLDIDAWGWRGGELVQLGTGRFDADPGVGLNSVIGSPASATLDLVDPEAPTPDQLVRELDLDGPGPVELRWTAPGGGVTHGLWQVTTLPPDSDRWLDPTGLVAQGRVEATTGGFEIDLESLATVPNTLTLGRSQPTYAQLTPSTVLPADTNRIDPAAVFVPSLERLVAAPESVPLPQPVRYWIRVVPMSGDQPVGIMTNTVEVDTAPEPEPAGDPDAQPYLISAELQPPTAPDLRYSACYLLEGWDLDRVDQAAFAVAQKYRFDNDGGYAAMTTGGSLAFSYWLYQRLLDTYGTDVPICAGCYGNIGLGGASCSSNDPNLIEAIVDAAVDFATGLWDDVIVASFEAIKDFVVETLVTVTGCEAIASEIGGDDGVAACRVLAEATVDAVLMAYGIPPSLPNTGDLIDAAKGDLEAMIVELAKSYGVPCDELADASAVTGEDISCEYAAGELLDELEYQLAESYRTSAPSTTGLYFPPGSRVIPYPAGQTGPARFDVTITPNPEAGEVEPGVCNLNTNLRSTWDTGPANSTGYAIVDVPGVTGSKLGNGWIWWVGVPPQTFEAWPFPANLRQVTVDPNAEVHVTYYLYQSGPMEPIHVIYGHQDGLGGRQLDGSLPDNFLLLHEGAQHLGVIIARCPASPDIVAHEVLVDTGAPGPGQ